ncbi:hypothetical protein HYV72_02255, partial [Candidatus Uhrbacteria bacterium]|nr:hypothetical protein [Candidatus Uhrbacteria bacterium]
GAFLTGGGAKLPGIEEVAKEVLRLPVTPGTPLGVMAAVSQVNDVAFSTAIGLVKWAQDLEMRHKTNTLSGVFSQMKGVDKVGGIIKGWFKELIP